MHFVGSLLLGKIINILQILQGVCKLLTSTVCVYIYIYIYSAVNSRARSLSRSRSLALPLPLSKLCIGLLACFWHI